MTEYLSPMVWHSVKIHENGSPCLDVYISFCEGPHEGLLQDTASWRMDVQAPMIQDVLQINLTWNHLERVHGMIFVANQRCRKCLLFLRIGFVEISPCTKIRMLLYQFHSTVISPSKLSPPENWNQQGEHQELRSRTSFDTFHSVLGTHIWVLDRFSSPLFGCRRSKNYWKLCKPLWSADRWRLIMFSVSFSFNKISFLRILHLCWERWLGIWIVFAPGWQKSLCLRKEKDVAISTHFYKPA